MVADDIEALAEHPGQQEVENRYHNEREEGVEGAAADDVGSFGEVLNGDVAHDGGGFDEGDELAFVDGQHALHGLRQDDVDEGAQGGEAHGDAGFCLSAVDAGDGGAEHFADVGGEVEGKGEDGDGGATGFPVGKDDVVHEQQEHENGCAAHEVNVGFGEPLQAFVFVHAQVADKGA